MVECFFAVTVTRAELRKDATIAWLETDSSRDRKVIAGQVSMIADQMQEISRYKKTIAERDAMFQDTLEQALQGLDRVSKYIGK